MPRLKAHSFLSYSDSLAKACTLLERRTLSTLLFVFKHFYSWNFQLYIEIYIIPLLFFIECFFYVWNLKFFIDWLGFRIIFYKIDMHPKLQFILLRHALCVVPCALHLGHNRLLRLALFKTMLYIRLVMLNT